MLLSMMQILNTFSEDIIEMFELAKQNQKSHPWLTIYWLKKRENIYLRTFLANRVMSSFFISKFL